MVLRGFPSPDRRSADETARAGPWLPYRRLVMASARGWRYVSSRRGFSIIEVAVAILITTVALVGSLALLMAALDTDSDSDARSRAVEISQDNIDRMRRTTLGAVAISQDALDSLSPAQKSAWEAIEGGSSLRMVTTGGSVDPVSSVGNYTVYRFVACAHDDDVDPGHPEMDCIDNETGDLMARTIRVVTERSNDSAGRSQLSAEVNETNINLAGGVGSEAIAAPSGLSISQVAEQSLWLSWSRPAGAVGYRIYRDDQEIGQATYNGFALTDPDLTSTLAGSLINFEVKAVGPDQTLSAATEAQILTRPYLGADSVVHSPGGNSISWEPDPMPGSDIDGFQVERQRGTGSWAAISGSELLSASSYNDSEGTCSDRYRIRVYRAGSVPGPGNTEAVHVATSAARVATQESCP